MIRYTITARRRKNLILDIFFGKHTLNSHEDAFGNSDLLFHFAQNEKAQKF